MDDRAVPGKRIRRLPADTWNDMEAAARAFREGKLSQETDGGGFDYPEPGFIKVRNDTGTALPRFSIVAIGSPWTTPSTGGAVLDVFKTRRTCAATIPVEADRGKFAILVDGCAPSGVVDAIASGIVQCQIVVSAGEESHEWADVEPGSTSVLHASSSGSARILWKETGTGTKWAQVRLSNKQAASDLMIRNNSGGARAKGEALEVTGVYSTPISSLEAETLTGELRALEAPRGILLADVASAATGPFAMHGVVFALIDILNADHTHCYVKSSDANPQSNFGGPWRIVAKPTGTGNAQPSLLLLGDPCYERKVKTAGTLTAGSSASCDFYINGSVKGQETVYFNWMESGVASVASGKEGLARWMDDEEKWVLVAAECD